MRDTLKGAVIGALVAAFATVLLAQTPPWTAPITWTTGDLLTAAQFNAQFRDNLLNLRAFSACAETGITGTASATTVLYGDCSWTEIPVTYSVALDMDSTSSTSTVFAAVGPEATIGSTDDDVALFVSGAIQRGLFTESCQLRIRNTSTNVTIEVIDPDSSIYRTHSYFSYRSVDAAPSATGDNVYQLEFRRASGTFACEWTNDAVEGVLEFNGSRGMIAVLATS